MTDKPPLPPARDVIPISVEEEMRRSYLDYAMSVIVARALPDIRDGLKPVHRRILYGMREGGYTSDKHYRKSARVVGDIIGKYHPHGEQAVYDALVRMTQDFSMRLPLLDGQGNFGSMDGDPPAAQRYTEVRLHQAGEALLADIDLDTVDFQPNYDETEREPVVLPSRIPNLLINGAGGIAVGMATNIPTHNLGEVIDACFAYMEKPDITIDEMMQHIPAPDFPTGGIMLGTTGAREAYHTGRGSITVRGRVHMEDLAKERTAIIIDDIPFQVNKSKMIEAIAQASRDKRIEGIAEIRDESSREGVRVVIEVRKDATPEVVLNQVYRLSDLQTNFSFNMVALTEGRPSILDLKAFISAFVTFREVVITRRTRHLLDKARERAQVLVGLAIAVANIDEVVKVIRNAPDPAAAREQLMTREWPAKDVASLLELIDDPTHRISDKGTYRLNDAQARAILDLRLQRLTGLEREKIAAELGELADKIRGYLDILASRARLRTVLREELMEVKAKFATPRRTEIGQPVGETMDEDLIEREDMVVTVTQSGYIKRTPLSVYRAQRRGGKGRTGMATREEDVVTEVFVANTHTEVLFFSTIGKVYKTKVYKLPLASPQAKGKAMVNLLPLIEGEMIAAVMPWPEGGVSIANRIEGMGLFFATAKGNVRRNALADFANIRPSGVLAIDTREGDRLVGVRPCNANDDVLLAARNGKCVRFPVASMRVARRGRSFGVRGMRLAEGDEVISLSVVSHVKAETEQRDEYLKANSARRRLAGGDYTGRDEDKARDQEVAAKLDTPEMQAMGEKEEFVLSVTANGYGKRTSAYEYRITSRGGSGITNIDTSERNGKVVASFSVEDGDHVVMMSDGGRIIRMSVDDIRVAGRNTQGVTLFTTAEGEKVVSVAHLSRPGDDEGTEKPPESAAGMDDPETPAEEEPEEDVADDEEDVAVDETEEEDS
ncbi:MAG: DNA gyrase subunit A [Alphaproteobacteria bacterium]|nr:DNA gyrase subunit A [Alphaproteobacteria bacterium]